MTIESISGWLGLVLVQSAVLPTTVNILAGNNTNIPPISMTVMILSGLIFYFIRALIQKDKIHLTSNGIGILSQSTLLALSIS